jgi:predicted aspartyl protease
MHTEVPFTLAGQRQPVLLIPASVNGNGPHPFLLDTGAGACLLTPELSRSLNVTITGTQTAAGAGGQVTVQLGQVASIEVGGAIVRDVPVAITPEIHRISASVGAEIAGDLGYTFLRHFRLSIDYRKRTIRLEESSEARPARIEIPFVLAAPAKPLVLVDGFVNGTGPWQLALDTGTSTTVLSADVAAKAGIALTEALPLTGGGGLIPTSGGMAMTVQIGSARVQDVDIRTGGFLDILSRVTGARLDGIVGYNILSRFCVIIDYPRSVLALE